MDIQLTSSDSLTIDIVESGVVSWEDLIRCVKTFHYDRNANRADVDLVWYERKGSCSSKHAFLKHVANLNRIDGVELMLCVYKMNAINTPKVSAVLKEFELEYVPEAHCYIRFHGEAIDVTTMTSSYSTINNDVIEEQVILPEKVLAFKVDYHKNFLHTWVLDTLPKRSFDEVWNAREACILALSA